MFGIVYSAPSAVQQYGPDGLPCCPTNTFCPGMVTPLHFGSL